MHQYNEHFYTWVDEANLLLPIVILFLSVELVPRDQTGFAKAIKV